MGSPSTEESQHIYMHAVDDHWYGGRVRWAEDVLIKAHQNNSPPTWDMAAPRDVSVDQLVKKIEESQYGFSSTLQGPFGTKRGEYIVDSN